MYSKLESNRFLESKSTPVNLLHKPYFFDSLKVIVFIIVFTVSMDSEATLIGDEFSVTRHFQLSNDTDGIDRKAISEYLNLNI